MDLESYNSLIASSDSEAAISYLTQMRREGVNPTVASYTAALRACCRESKGEEANGLVDEMWQKGIDPDPACYALAMRACRKAEESELADNLLWELRQWGPAPDVVRFHTVPRLEWGRYFRRAGAGVSNSMTWRGRGPVPEPAAGHACWLLPNQEDVAISIAERQDELREAGWKVVSSAPEIISTLGNKASFREFAADIGMEHLLPRHYFSFELARYPCVLKPAQGTWGKDTHILYCSEDGQRRVGTYAPSDKWVLQELISGREEYSTSLLVLRGEILDYACTKYTYDQDIYVWPNGVEEVRNDHVAVPAKHLAAMRPFLRGYSGVCNFNYKLRGDGEMCIFEVNPRIGGDLAFDVPRPRARAFMEKLDRMLG